jgi:hypothetical protein
MSCRSHGSHFFYDCVLTDRGAAAALASPSFAAVLTDGGAAAALASVSLAVVLRRCHPHS